MTFVFWSKRFNAKMQQEDTLYTHKQLSDLASLLKQVDEQAVKDRMLNMRNKMKPFPLFINEQVVQPEEKYKRPPLLIGSLTNWEYKPMMKIEEFLAMMDPDHVEPLDDMVKRRVFSSTSKGLQDLGKYEYLTYVREYIQFRQYYLKDWLSHLMRTATRGYKNPCLLNVNEFDSYPTHQQLRNEEQLAESAFPVEEEKDVSKLNSNKNKKKMQQDKNQKKEPENSQDINKMLRDMTDHE